MAPSPSQPTDLPPLIALEGIDGAGTTTQLRRLGAWLSAQGVPVVTTAQPSQGAIGLLCRQALQARPALPADALALLFAADRMDHQQTTIAQALAQPAWVLCDRHVMSSFAYQSLNLPMAWVRAINAQAQPPTLSILVEVPVALAQQRLAARGGPTETFDALATQTRVAQAYGALARDAQLGHPACIVDGAGTEAQVTQQLCALVQPYVDAWRSRRPTGLNAAGFGNPRGLS